MLNENNFILQIIDIIFRTFLLKMNQSSLLQDKFINSSNQCDSITVPANQLHSICKAETNACTSLESRSRYSLLKAYHTCQTYFHFHGLTPDHIILKSSNGTGATGWRPVTIQTRQPRANSWGLDNFRGFDVYEKASARDAGNDNPAIQEKPTVQPVTQYRFDSREKSHEAAKFR